MLYVDLRWIIVSSSFENELPQKVGFTKYFIA